jgi:hypothetical protein
MEGQYSKFKKMFSCTILLFKKQDNNYLGYLFLNAPYVRRKYKIYKYIYKYLI